MHHPSNLLQAVPVSQLRPQQPISVLVKDLEYLQETYLTLPSHLQEIHLQITLAFLSSLRSSHPCLGHPLDLRTRHLFL